MDYVDTATTKRHVRASFGRKGELVLTLCGVRVKATATGASIATMIDCGNCRTALRTAGYTL